MSRFSKTIEHSKSEISGHTENEEEEEVTDDAKSKTNTINIRNTRELNECNSAS